MPTNLIIGSGKTAKKSIQGGVLSPEKIKRDRLYQIGTQLAGQINEQWVRADAITTKIDRIENIHIMNNIKQRDNSMTEEILDRLYDESESLESEISNLTDRYNEIRQYLDYEQSRFNEFIQSDPRAAAEEEEEQKEEPETLQEEKDDFGWPPIPEDAEDAD